MIIVLSRDRDWVLSAQGTTHNPLALNKSIHLFLAFHNNILKFIVFHLVSPVLVEPVLTLWSQRYRGSILWSVSSILGYIIYYYIELMNSFFCFHFYCEVRLFHSQLLLVKRFLPLEFHLLLSVSLHPALSLWFLLFLRSSLIFIFFDLYLTLDQKSMLIQLSFHRWVFLFASHLSFFLVRGVSIRVLRAIINRQIWLPENVRDNQPW